MAGKPKFRVGQVVAYRMPDGAWDYDRILSIRPAAPKEWNESAYLSRSDLRLDTRNLRLLTKREAGR
jgi:hypothetical protein